MIRRNAPNELLLAIVAAVWLLVAPAAWADADPAGGANAETEHNRLSFHPSIQVTGVADSNVELADGDESEGDLGAFLLPRVELGYQGRWFNLGADLAADIRLYADNSSPSDEFFRLSGFGELGLMPGLTLRLSNAWVPTPVNLGLPEDHAANLIQSNRAVVDLSYWRPLPAGREMRLSFQGTRLDSESFRTEVGDGLFDDDFHADYWEGSVVAELQSPLYQGTSGFFRTDARYRSFDDSTASDFGDVNVLLGVRTHWFGSVDFDIASGVGFVDFDSGSTLRILGQSNIRYRMPDGTTLRLSVVNRNTADIVGNDFMETSGRIALERRFGERTAASVELFLSRFDNEMWDSGANLYGGVETRIRRQLTRRTQLAFLYRYWDNGGDYETDDFTQHQATLVFTYRR
jgi:hypothetical protein